MNLYVSWSVNDSHKYFNLCTTGYFLKYYITNFRIFSILQCFDIIFKPLCKELTRCHQKGETDGNAEHALSVAVFMLLVVKSNEIKEEACLKLIRKFYSAFLLTADTVKKICPNYDLLKRNFPTRLQ